MTKAGNKKQHYYCNVQCFIFRVNNHRRLFFKKKKHFSISSVKNNRYDFKNTITPSSTPWVERPDRPRRQWWCPAAAVLGQRQCSRHRWEPGNPRAMELGAGVTRGSRQASICPGFPFPPIKSRYWAWCLLWSPSVFSSSSFAPDHISHAVISPFVPVLWHVCVFFTLWMTELGHCSTNPIVNVSPVETTGYCSCWEWRSCAVPICP